MKPSSDRSPGRLAAALAALGGGAATARDVVLEQIGRLREGPFLSRREQVIVGALADAFFPPGGAIPLSGREAGLVAYMDDYCKQLPAGQGRLVRLLFVFLEHSPWAFGPRRQRFSTLSLADRIEVLDRMRNSPIYFRRIAFLSMRTMLTMGYLADERVARRIGMVPNPDPYGLGARGVASVDAPAASEQRVAS